MKFLQLLTFLIITTFIFACDSGPKVIEAESAAPENASYNKASTDNNAPVFKDVSAPSNNTGEHRVTVEEVLNTEKYSYLKLNAP